jgi:hypothetical protein
MHTRLLPKGALWVDYGAKKNTLPIRSEYLFLECKTYPLNTAPNTSFARRTIFSRSLAVSVSVSVRSSA